MNYQNLIISNEWSLDEDKNELKIVHQEQESTYNPSWDVIVSIHVANSNALYFVFDDDKIVLSYDGDTGIIKPICANEKNVLVADERSMRSSHVSKQFTRFLFGEFLRNCGL